MSAGTIELRPATKADEPFLRGLFTEVRSAEFPGMDAGTLDPLLSMQYRALLAERSARHPHAETSIIVAAGEPAGSMTVDRDGARVHLVDIAVSPAHRGRGIASTLLADLVASAEHVTLTVWSLNTAARRLYERHGFSAVAEQFGYVLMATEAEA